MGQQQIHCFWRPGGGFSSVHVEPEIWDLFRLAAIEREMTISKLLAEVNRTHRLQPRQAPSSDRVLGLSAAVRVFVLRDLMRKLADAEARAARRGRSRQ